MLDWRVQCPSICKKTSASRPRPMLCQQGNPDPPTLESGAPTSAKRVYVNGHQRLTHTNIKNPAPRAFVVKSQRPMTAIKRGSKENTDGESDFQEMVLASDSSKKRCHLNRCPSLKDSAKDLFICRLDQESSHQWCVHCVQYCIKYQRSPSSRTFLLT